MQSSVSWPTCSITDGMVVVLLFVKQLACSTVDHAGYFITRCLPWSGCPPYQAEEAQCPWSEGATIGCTILLVPMSWCVALSIESLVLDVKLFYMDNVYVLEMVMLLPLPDTHAQIGKSDS